MTYKRLNITAEGQTEMEFAKNTLSKHLVNHGLTVDARCVITSKNKRRAYRGGLSNYEKARKDILNWIAEDKTGDCYFTTMFDLYALPNNFPKFKEAELITDPYQRVQFLEQALADDIGHYKFIPYIQLHEFEALLLAKPEAFLIEYEDAEKAVEELKKTVEDNEDNPEKVNNGEETAPSKRIIKLIPKYDGNKVTVGVILADMLGVEFLKTRCQHFSYWVEKLENINPSVS